MRLGILETGRPPEGLDGPHGTYPLMFERLLGPDFSYRSWPVMAGELPETPRDAEAWLVTGSAAGVYDPEPWIAPLEEFLRRSLEAGVPAIGICFGHQVLASALGARVEKAEAGWGVGPHRYEVVWRPPWMEADVAAFTVNAMHQDQVLTMPEGAQLVARNDFCPIAALAYGDRAISFQGHPEFANPYERDLIEARRGHRIPDPLAEAALARLGEAGTAPDAPLVARWIRRFLGVDR